MQLSILIPTIYGREYCFDDLMIKLKGNKKWKEIGYASNEGEWRCYQCDDLPVNILVLKDRKEKTVGEKRNLLMEAASGDYIVYHDCDDLPSDDYIEQLLEGTKSGADIITFQVSVSINGAIPKLCFYSKRYETDYNTSDAYYRLPNHIMCVKRELALRVKFPLQSFGEDADYAKRLRPLLITQHTIDKVLYYYNFNSQTTETQRK